MPLPTLLRRALAGALAPLLFGACSGNGARVSVRPLPAPLTAGWEADRSLTSDDQVVYRFSGSSDEVPIFLTIVDECPVATHVSPEATTRQLLVGLEKIRVERQRELTLDGHRSLESILSAELDGVPLSLSTLSVRNPPCVVDYIVWGRESSTGRAAFEAARASLVERLGAGEPVK